METYVGLGSQILAGEYYTIEFVSRKYVTPNIFWFCENKKVEKKTGRLWNEEIFEFKYCDPENFGKKKFKKKTIQQQNKNYNNYKEKD